MLEKIIQKIHTPKNFTAAKWFYSISVLVCGKLIR